MLTRVGPKTTGELGWVVVAAGQKGIPLNIIQRWVGHARTDTTAIYISVIGDEERNLAQKGVEFA